MIRLALVWALLCATVAGASAHELRPSLLTLRETAPGAFDVSLRVSVAGASRVHLSPVFPAGCAPAGPSAVARDAASEVTRLRIACDGPIEGRPIRIAGLSGTLNDVLVRVDRLDGPPQTTRVLPEDPVFALAAAPTRLDIARTYAALGLQHILLGLDHLLFVLALLLLIRAARPLVATITAFTVAHSITLALSAFGLARAPQPLVEALVALSIVVVAAEIVAAERGGGGAARLRPWTVAFAFGLLHGLGFGGALIEIGLPEGEVPLALLAFNLGVETGQLLVIAVALAAAASLVRLLALPRLAARHPLGLVLGCVAGTWFGQRVLGLVGIA